ncbi:hypothetical protein BC828DRAFT_394424 [Blastocladiella britannica]|nr:hypothetical protein BC828DRAFT_394424 [Blastocladiella britannica]
MRVSATGGAHINLNNNNFNNFNYQATTNSASTGSVAHFTATSDLAIGVFAALAIVVPMVLAAAVTGCLWGTRSKGGSDARGRGLQPTTAAPTMSLQVSIPTSMLMDDKMIDLAANGATAAAARASPSHSPGPMPPAPIAPPPAAITRGAAAPEAPQLLNPALLVQLLHSQLHEQQQARTAAAGLATPPETPRAGTPSAPALALTRSGSFGVSSPSYGSSAGTPTKQAPSLILPDKTTLVRANFDVLAIPEPLPPTTTMGANYGARHLVADMDHLYNTVSQACTKATPLGGPNESAAALRLAGRVSGELLTLMRELTSRSAGEQLWMPLIYAYHDEYKPLPRTSLLAPAEVYLAVHELMYDQPHADAVQAAVRAPLDACAHRLRSLLRAVSAPDAVADALAASLPWAAVALLVRAKRYRPSLAFVEITGTGMQPEPHWMDVLNAGEMRLAGRNTPSTAGYTPDDREYYGPLATVSTFVWPGVLDLADGVVRVRARVLISA